MKWTIKLNDTVQCINLSSSAVSQRDQFADIDGATVKYAWDLSSMTLVVKDSPVAGVDSHIHVRSVRRESFPGESESRFYIDVWNPQTRSVQSLIATAELAAPGQEHRKSKSATQGERIRAPMTGKVLQVLVRDGQAVKAGDVVMIIEAMKMENKITVNSNGVVSKLNVNAGQSVTVGGDLLLVTPPPQS